MATIIEDYCSKEIYRLLIEKGFDGEVHTTFDDEGYTQPSVSLQMAMKWLREVRKIHIIAEPCLGEGNESNLSFNRWFWTILKEEGEYKPIRQIDEFPTYEEACEAAIKYSLENLI